MFLRVEFSLCCFSGWTCWWRVHGGGFVGATVWVCIGSGAEPQHWVWATCSSEGVLTHGRRVGTRRSLRSLPTRTIPWSHGSATLGPWSCKCLGYHPISWHRPCLWSSGGSWCAWCSACAWACAGLGLRPPQRSRFDRRVIGEHRAAAWALGYISIAL